jgi:alpha,alpha-trehalase
VVFDCISVKRNKPFFFREDVSTAQEAFHTDEEKEAYYSELKAAAESGWDFSSRWFIQNATNKGKPCLLILIFAVWYLD